MTCVVIIWCISFFQQQHSSTNSPYLVSKQSSIEPFEALIHCQSHFSTGKRHRRERHIIDDHTTTPIS